jgi:hypothetical protein
MKAELKGMLKLTQNECDICCCTAQGVKVSTAQSDQTIRKKICQIFQRIAQSHQVKKGQNIYNKAQFENPKHLHQTTFKTFKYLQKQVLKLLI